MSRISVGSIFPDFEITTVKKGKTSISEIIGKKGKTAIIFLRYFGCTLCQYDILQYKNDYEDIIEGGGNIIIVLQSTVESIGKQSAEAFPFDIICDAEQELYRQLEIEPVDNLKKAVGPSFLLKQVKMMKAGLRHGDYEGNENQLPAYFLVGQDRIVQLANYSKDLLDVPSGKDLIKMFTE